jgi:hypothetical protein
MTSFVCLCLLFQQELGSRMTTIWGLHGADNIFPEVVMLYAGNNQSFGQSKGVRLYESLLIRPPD